MLCERYIKFLYETRKPDSGAASELQFQPEQSFRVQTIAVLLQFMMLDYIQIENPADDSLSTLGMNE